MKEQERTLCSLMIISSQHCAHKALVLVLIISSFHRFLERFVVRALVCGKQQKRIRKRSKKQEARSKKHI